MIVVYIIALVLLSLTGYLLFAPFYFEVDSNQGLLRFRFHKAASISLKLENTLFLELKVFGWIKKLDVESPYKKTETTNKKPNNQIRNRVSFAQLSAVLKSFKIKSCRISIDTGDVQWNAMLFPVFYFLHWRSGKNLEINFTGKNEIVLHIKNNIARMGWAFISSK
ncbi:MAG: hypothetical protein JNL60_05295 [Bacteroidia bacterium]|nr:hypothetical protein [Bacteroidia bacterium]